MRSSTYVLLYANYAAQAGAVQHRWAPAIGVRVCPTVSTSRLADRARTLMARWSGMTLSSNAFPLYLFSLSMSLFAKPVPTFAEHMLSEFGALRNCARGALPPSTADRSQCRLTTPRRTKHIHELSYRAQVLQMADGFDRPLDRRGRQHAFRIGAEFVGDPGAS